MCFLLCTSSESAMNGKTQDASARALPFRSDNVPHELIFKLTPLYSLHLTQSGSCHARIDNMNRAQKKISILQAICSLHIEIINLDFRFAFVFFHHSSLLHVHFCCGYYIVHTEHMYHIFPNTAYQKPHRST